MGPAHRRGQRGASLSLLAPALALLSAATWGAADFAGGIATRLGNNVVAVLVGQVAALAVAATVLLVSGEGRPPAEGLGWAVVAGVGGVSGLYAFYLALSRGSMGLVAPTTALIAATIPALIGIGRGDAVSALVLAGMGAAIGAVILISLPAGGRHETGPSSASGSGLQQWALILAAGLGFAIFFLSIDASHDAGGAVWWPLVVVKSVGVVLAGGVTVGLLVTRRGPTLSVARVAIVVAALAGVGDLGGNLFFVLASGVGDLSVVVVLASLYPVTTALLARLLLHERLGRVRVAGVVLAIIGVAFIGLGSL